MAKIASPVKIRRRLHALPVAFGLLALWIVVLMTKHSSGF
jgi:translation elongation factor EF-1beta